jgi:hypothetical protein
VRTATSRVLAGLLGVVWIGTATACGPDDADPTAVGVSAVASVPALADRLAAVDEAMAAQDWPTALRALTAVQRLTTQAEESGRLTGEQAERILAATSRLSAALPAAALAPSDGPESTTASPGGPDPDDEGTDAGTGGGGTGGGSGGPGGGGAGGGDAGGGDAGGGGSGGGSGSTEGQGSPPGHAGGPGGSSGNGGGKGATSGRP